MRTALAYRAETIGGDDTKLIGHPKRHRRISNEDVRNFLDRDVATAHNRLTRMRRKGWIRSWVLSRPATTPVEGRTPLYPIDSARLSLYSRRGYRF